MNWASTASRPRCCGQHMAVKSMRAKCNRKGLSFCCHHKRTVSSFTSRKLTLPPVHRQSLQPPDINTTQLRYISSPSVAHVQKRVPDRDVIVSVLEVAATRRDAKGYLQKFANKGPNARIGEHGDLSWHPEQVHQGKMAAHETLHVAITKMRSPQLLSQDTIHGVAKTFVQLRLLGLISVIVIDCGQNESRDVFENEALRICEAIDSFGKPATKLAHNIFLGYAGRSSKSSVISSDLIVEDRGLLLRALQQRLMPVIPALASPDAISVARPTSSHDAVIALTKYFSGLQFSNIAEDALAPSDDSWGRPRKLAAVERIIVLDPLGATPMAGRPEAPHRFINLEQEYESLVTHLATSDHPLTSANDHRIAHGEMHAANLTLARDALSILPSSSSALITTPQAAANTAARKTAEAGPSFDKGSGFGFDMVATRKKQNPLLHNLLTDKPVYSSSLPVKRVQGKAKLGLTSTDFTTAATLVKRGMPLTILPDPRTELWLPPKPHAPPLRLTDRTVDLPRLVHLIEDSFNRKLDVEHYLSRVNDTLAGIIIAGEYEGGAILTWEVPPGLTKEEAYKNGRMVPYLDKFAVLKSRQGSGGVADIVFSAMVQGCFPEGVCWRSRQDNPVNKWYFERSTGTSKLSSSNWSMFWTTPGLTGDSPTLHDYEAVCRAVEPSWADKKHILD